MPAPATIEDAMQAVKNFGRRFLWIDRHSIPKAANKHIQIQNMGLVYGGALATIVAVSGTDPGPGLPGVSYARRPQPSVGASIGMLVSTLKHVSDRILRSK